MKINVGIFTIIGNDFDVEKFPLWIDRLKKSMSEYMKQNVDINLHVMTTSGVDISSITHTTFKSFDHNISGVFYDPFGQNISDTNIKAEVYSDILELVHSPYGLKDILDMREVGKSTYVDMFKSIALLDHGYDRNIFMSLDSIPIGCIDQLFTGWYSRVLFADCYSYSKDALETVKLNPWKSSIFMTTRTMSVTQLQRAITFAPNLRGRNFDAVLQMFHKPGGNDEFQLLSQSFCFDTNSILANDGSCPVNIVTIPDRDYVGKTLDKQREVYNFYTNLILEQV